MKRNSFRIILSAMLIFGMALVGCASPDVSVQQNIEVARRIVDTGQVEAYNSDGEVIETVEGEAFYGQDADYASLPFSFRENGDGTVTDLNTGLTWLQTPSDEKMTWSQAMEYCDSLEYGGRDDWRAPTLTELISIEDFSDGWPYIDLEVFSFGDRDISKALQFWSSNFYYVGTTHGGLETAFGLNFGTGHIKGYPTGDQAPGEGMDGEEMPPPPGGDPSNTGDKPGDGLVGDQVSSAGDGPGGNPPPGGNPAVKYVWAVTGDEYGSSEYVENGDGTVTDLGTGLMWMVDDSGIGLDWEDSLAYAENMEFVGYDDWRLPNVKELQSLVDYSGCYPAIDQSLFNITDEDSYFWTSTSAYFSKTSDEQFKRYWAWYVAFGYAVGLDGEDSHGAGAVRYDTKAEDGPTGEDAERVFNYARAVRSID